MIELLNKIHHADWLTNNLPDKSVQLIIADPPYFEVKGSFDFVWQSFDDYLKDVEKWAIECKRLLAENGTLYWFGGSKRIAYTQVIFDKYFGLVNNLVWEKAEAGGLFGTTGSEQLRSYPNSTERILMYEQRGQKTGGELIFEQFLKPKNPFSKYLKIEFKNAKVTNKEIAKLFPSKTGGLTGCVSNWLNGDNVITEEQYLKIREYLNNKYLLKPYEELKAEYEELRRPFENVTKSTEILKVRFKPSEYDHPTVKPEMLARLLILTSSRKNDLVLIPFAGSGTEVAMSIKEGRKAIGYDIEKKYVDMANRRVDIIKAQPSLFCFA